MIRFSSSAAGDVDMLDEHARRLIEIVGKAAGPRGVITAEQIPAAITALRAAAERERQQTAEPAPDDEDDAEERERQAQHVGLGQRAFPLIDLLERSARKQADVTWGV